MSVASPTPPTRGFAHKEGGLYPANSPARLVGTAQPDVILYTDGACLGNPGPGGWAAIILDGEDKYEVCGGEPHSTNQRMELRAAIEGLRAVRGEGRRVALHSDSAYLVNGFTLGWVARWQRNGWRTTRGSAVENRDLWEQLAGLGTRHDVEWRKVRGHSGDPLNERADWLAVEQARRSWGG
jgi:ribonuclease HI